jgi:uncharacterized membrane protein
MAVYHFTWDLEFLGYIDAGTTAVGGWKLFARSIASTFLFLVGVSLVLAHGKGVRWPAFLRRFAMIGAAAALISLATFIAVPADFIFFGILHQIALASLLGLLFLNLPWPLVIAAAAVVILSPHFLRAEIFDHPAWWWLGLSPVNPRSNDYVPLFPWFGAVLAGMGTASLAARAGLLPRLASIEVPRAASPLVFAGRHSLAFYLLHQPLLIAGLWLFSQAFPPAAHGVESEFLDACEAACVPERDIAFCAGYCVCVHDMLDREGLLDSVTAGRGDAGSRSRTEQITTTCTAQTERAFLKEGQQ